MFENEPVANIFTKKWPPEIAFWALDICLFDCTDDLSKSFALGALNLFWPYPKLDSFWQVSYTATFKRQYETLIKEFEEM